MGQPNQKTYLEWKGDRCASELLDEELTFDYLRKYIDPDEVGNFELASVIGRVRKIVRRHVKDEDE